MAGNVVLNPGALGATLATDQATVNAATADVQYVKLMDGTAGGNTVAAVGAAGLKVDGSGVTQPVSGTVTTSPPANASTNVAQLAGTTTDTNSGVKSAGTLRVVIATDQPQLTNKLLVTPDSVALPANQSVNLNQAAGTALDVNSGNKSAGTIRVVLATDQPALTNKLLVTPDSVALPANQSVNVSQINGVTPLMGNGVTGTGSQRVTIASDNTAFTVNAAQSGTWNVGTVTTVTSLTQMNGAAISMNTGVRDAGTQRVTIATNDVVPASQSGTWTVQPGNTANTTAWLVNDAPVTTGGLSFNGFVGAASNNKTQIKGSAGQLYMVSVQNLAATPVYLKVFNNTSAGVTMGTTNCDFQFMIPGNTAGAGIVLNIDKGIAMGTGITIALTAAIATNDNTSVSANQQVVTIGYK